MTREQRRRERRFNIFFSVLLILLTVICLSVDAVSTENAAEIPEPKSVKVDPLDNTDLLLSAQLAVSDVNKPAQEPMTYEDWFRAEANRIDNCMLTHYCVEQYEHICGTGDGITSTGVPVTAGWTCAVDEDVIPYGAEVMVDYGDHVEFFKAQDCGPWINGNHIDLAVETHAEAEELGIKYATVYWLLPEEDPT